MKKGGILHPQLARAIAEMGHYDLMLVVGAAFPIAAELRDQGRVIDVAVAPSCPSPEQVLSAIRTEMWVEKLILIEDARQYNQPYVDGVHRIFPDALIDTKSNDWFHDEGGQSAKYVVRTGGWTPFGNVGLVAGIPFVDWVASTGGKMPAEWRERHDLQLSHLSGSPQAQGDHPSGTGEPR
ncbi:RbsD/FucU domain-containing protein [Oricola indica]|jgi:D-ribose pyranase|uniref:RbsD/FucU domain-containing protein n=1 Tax=Oricola indica TaxID=2872591 RepID=UPI001CC017A2|nr:RbsD/FucU domain-containing protein [Oricola indica]